MKDQLKSAIEKLIGAEADIRKAVVVIAQTPGTPNGEVNTILSFERNIINARRTIEQRLNQIEADKKRSKDAEELAAKKAAELAAPVEPAPQ